MKITEMKKTDFYKVPSRKRFDEPVICDTLVILPQRGLHDSGYRLMDFCACVDGEPVCRVSGCSDVIKFDGIGGMGENWIVKNGGLPKVVTVSAWEIDCLPKSGLLQIFSYRKRIKVGPSLSSFSIYAVDRIAK